MVRALCSKMHLRNMGDHYVPQYYLKGFSNREGKQIWVYDKQERRKFLTQVKSIANVTGFYSPEVEQYLADTIEVPANRVIRKIRDRGQITGYDKGILAEYMAVMMKRVPKGKERLREHAPSVARKLSQETGEQLTIMASTHPEKATLIQKRKSEIQEILDKYSKDPPKEIWLDNIPPERSPGVVAALTGMTWRFLTFDDKPVFLTSDNPVFYFTSIGIGKPESEVTFPISSYIILWATWRTDLPKGYITATNQTVKEINRRTVRNALRYLFHRKDEYWILPFVTKGRWKLNRFR